MTNEPVDETYVYHCGVDWCPNQVMLTDDQFQAVWDCEVYFLLIPDSDWWYSKGDYICPDCAKRCGLSEHSQWSSPDVIAFVATHSLESEDGDE